MAARAKETHSALARLEELRAAGVAARERVGECESQARRASRDVDGAAAALRNYYAALEDGDQPDADLESRLRAELAALQARAPARLVTSRGQSRLEHVDLEIEARLVSARGAVESAESAVGDFIREHRAELEAEMVERSCEASDELVLAFARVDEALGRWRRCANRWHAELLPHWGDISAAEIPNLAPR
jgi:chromosome segregation ATPase